MNHKIKMAIQDAVRSGRLSDPIKIRLSFRFYKFLLLLGVEEKHADIIAKGGRWDAVFSDGNIPKRNRERLRKMLSLYGVDFNRYNQHPYVHA